MSDVENLEQAVNAITAAAEKSEEAGEIIGNAFDELVEATQFVGATQTWLLQFAGQLSEGLGPNSTVVEELRAAAETAATAIEAITALGIHLEQGMSLSGNVTTALKDYLTELSNLS